jgi:hypothetical protein
MAQTFTDDCFAANHVGLTDLQNIEDNFQAVKSLFSGSSAPANTTGGMPWFDTAKKILKVRNSTNGAWLGVHYSSTAARWWVYANVAGDGWIVDSSVADRVLAIKGGSQAYNAVGGSGAGTWTLAGFTVGNESTHQHPSLSHTHTLSGGVVHGEGSTDVGTFTVYSAVDAGGTGNTGAGSAHSHGLSQDATWRPLASIGTLQYLDI